MITHAVVGTPAQLAFWQQTPLAPHTRQVWSLPQANLGDVQAQPTDVLWVLATEQESQLRDWALLTRERKVVLPAHATSLYRLLRAVAPAADAANLFGINALPGMLERDRWELSHLNPPVAQDWVAQLQKQGPLIELIPDGPAMVTPRVIAMIVNEAGWLLQEQGATAADIDNALKLGVNYPLGPLEWLDKWSPAVIIAILESLGTELGTDTYKIAPYLHRRWAEQTLD